MMNVGWGDHTIMNEPQLEEFATDFSAMLRDALATYPEGSPQAIGLPRVGFPTPEQIKQLVGRAIRLGLAVRAESVSISGGMFVSLGVTFKLPQPGGRKSPEL